jgi:hypothetical protein
MLTWFGFLIIFLIIGYFIYVSYSFQSYLFRTTLKKSFIKEFSSSVKGEFMKKGFFATNHKIISENEHKTYLRRHKLSFSPCYNIIRFKTPSAHWELFFHLVKEGQKYSEIMSLRVFPNQYHIRSEGNVEKNYSRLNIFTNNRYLTTILESGETKDYLKWLIRHNEDILLISHNNLHFKAFVDSKKLTVKRVLDMVKSLHVIKNKIYRKDVIEY